MALVVHRRILCAPLLGHRFSWQAPWWRAGAHQEVQRAHQPPRGGADRLVGHPLDELGDKARTDAAGRANDEHTRHGYLAAFVLRVRYTHHQQRVRDRSRSLRQGCKAKERPGTGSRRRPGSCCFIRYREYRLISVCGLLPPRPWQKLHCVGPAANNTGGRRALGAQSKLAAGFTSRLGLFA
jgi:hypothetical protein